MSSRESPNDPYWRQVEEAPGDGSVSGDGTAYLDDGGTLHVSWRLTCPRCSQGLGVDMTMGTDLVAKTEAWEKWAKGAKAWMLFLCLIAVTSMGLLLLKTACSC